jgi:inorganic pyrophosphatase
MRNLLDIPLWSKKGVANVVVETPRGARAKFAFDPEFATFTYSKPMTWGLAFPTDWGFLPSTLAPDGDALDALIIHDVQTFPGLVVECRIIGVLETLERKKRKSVRNDRVIAVPLASHRDRRLEDVSMLAPEVKDELERFFNATNALKKKRCEFRGWHGARAALHLIQKASQRYEG